MSYRRQTLGRTIEVKKKFVLLDTGPSFRIRSPYSIPFNDRNYRDVFPWRMVFNFTSFIEFEPRTIVITQTMVFIMRSVIITVQNILEDEVLRILDIETTSKELFVLKINSTDLRPKEKLAMTIYVCPTEEGLKSCFVLVHTSKGVVPFNIIIRAIQDPRDRGIDTVYYQSSSILYPISMRIPPVIASRNLSIVFDSLIFNSARSGFTERFIQLSPMHLKSGYYLTFVHMLNGSDGRSFPLVVSVSPKLLQSHRATIYLNTIERADDFSEAEIKLVNPTSVDCVILSVTLSRDAPSNVRIERENLPYMLATKHSHIVVGRVVVYGTKPGDVQTTVLVTYEDSQKKKTETLEIPVRGYVEYGCLEPSEPSLDIFASGKVQFYTINFTNRFQVPVAVIAAYTDSLLVKVHTFTPACIGPGNVSENIVLLYEMMNAINQTDIMLFVETNVTVCKIPITVYTGGIQISKQKDVFISKTLIVNMGKILCGSVSVQNFFIRNPNPIPHVMTSFHATPGIHVNGQWTNNDGEILRDHVIKPNETDEITLYIRFPKLKNLKPRNDTITLGSSGSSVQLIVSWIPTIGDVSSRTSLPEVLTIGKIYNGKLYANATFTSTFKDLETRWKFITLAHTSELLLKKGVSMHIGNVSMSFTPETSVGTNIEVCFSDWKNFSHQARVWQRVFLAPKACTFDYSVVFPKMKYSSYLTFTVTHHTFDNITVDIGRVLVHSTAFVTVNITNELDFWIALHGSSLDETIPPHEESPVMFPVSIGDIGHVDIEYPITTNFTPPFFVRIIGVAVTPILEFYDGESPTDSVFFSLRDPPVGGKWIQSVRLRNSGIVDADIQNLTCVMAAVQIDTDCLKTLAVKETCMLNISVSVKHLEKVRNNSVIEMHSHGISSYLRVEFAHLEETLQLIRAQQRCKTVTLLILVIGFPLWRIIQWVTRSIRFMKRVSDRMNLIEEEISHLTIVSKRSIGIQVFPSNQITGGSWITEQNTDISVSFAAINDMESYLTNLYE